MQHLARLQASGSRLQASGSGVQASGSGPLDRADLLKRRTVIERVRPQIDGGPFPVKRTLHGHVQVPLDILGRRPDEPYVVTDLLTGEVFVWRGEWNYVRFDPGIRQGHILRIGG